MVFNIFHPSSWSPWAWVEGGCARPGPWRRRPRGTAEWRGNRSCCGAKRTSTRTCCASGSASWQRTESPASLSGSSLSSTPRIRRAVSLKIIKTWITSKVLPLLITFPLWYEIAIEYLFVIIIWTIHSSTELKTKTTKSIVIQCHFPKTCVWLMVCWHLPVGSSSSYRACGARGGDASGGSRRRAPSSRPSSAWPCTCCLWRTPTEFCCWSAPASPACDGTGIRLSEASCYPGSFRWFAVVYLEK